MLSAVSSVFAWGRRHRWLPLGCWLGVLGIDALLRHAPSYFVLGLIDEPGHFLTSVILLLAVATVTTRPLPAPFITATLLAGNLIDLDHLPQSLGTDVLTAGTARPYPHSVTTIVLLLLAARVLSGKVVPILLGVALGVTGHLLRDLGTAPVALLWPLTDRSLWIPHRLYLSVLLILAAAPLARPRSSRPPGPAPDRPN
jgi:membrane-bound metal-dependent hydrolase YbcI (DUF457 family)